MKEIYEKCSQLIERIEPFEPIIYVAPMELGLFLFSFFFNNYVAPMELGDLEILNI
jgi:hypothetical protein